MKPITDWITEESKFNSTIYVNTYLNDTGNDLKF